MPQPGNLTYILDFWGGSSLTEREVREAGGFAVCVARAHPKLESMRVVDTSTGKQVCRVVVRGDLRPVFARLVETAFAGEIVREGVAHYRPVEKAIRAVVYGWQRTLGDANVRALTWVTRNEVFFSDRDLDQIEET